MQIAPREVESILREDGTFDPKLDAVRITIRKGGQPTVTRVYQKPLGRLDHLVEHEGSIVITSVDNYPPFVGVTV